MAVPGKAGRVVAGVIVVAIIAVGVIMGFNPFGSNVPEGVDTDATEVYVLDDDVTRQFISRDRNTIWITEETAERIGVEDAAE